MEKYHETSARNPSLQCFTTPHLALCEVHQLFCTLQEHGALRFLSAMALEHGTNGPIATSGTSPISLSLSVGRDCPQPSHEDAPKNPNNTAMQVNCSHSWNALAIYMCVSLQNLSARIVWIHLSIKSDQSTHIKYEYQDFQHLLPDPSWFHHRRASA